MTDVAAILNGYFAGGSVPATLYIGLVSVENYTQFSPLTDSMGSHPGWQEFTDYNESTRPEWTPGVVVDGYPASVNNPAVATITPLSDGRAKGVFLCDDSSKGGATGQLYGPWFFDEGVREIVTGAPFLIDLTITLKPNTSVAN